MPVASNPVLAHKTSNKSSPLHAARTPNWALPVYYVSTATTSCNVWKAGAAVNELYHHIINDPWHHQVLLLRYTDIVKRDFENWAMGYMGLTAENKEILLRFSTQPMFDPFKMRASQKVGWAEYMKSSSLILFVFLCSAQPATRLL